MTQFPPVEIPEVLELPVTGRDGVARTYRLEDPPATDGSAVCAVVQRAARMAAAGAGDDVVVVEDADEEALYRRCLGDVYERLVADVAPETLRAVAHAVMRWLWSGNAGEALAWWHEQTNTPADTT